MLHDYKTYIATHRLNRPGGRSSEEEEKLIAMPGQKGAGGCEDSGQ